ncbi:uncharacterized protein LOC126891285 [Diabrotica virgifera virgifera]|uniref:Reverse transcriptase domain-containing protein n=1 Tax=Diabrotica virgifera virgifera TaxID=50390 RepID=A0ABM5L1V4_DIAVI|nr:uncharacterized protein LOC126891285 [Diabrotica virgifera virgifera]
MPDALNTVFGYVLMGPCSAVPMASATSFCHVDQMVSLEESVKQFWSLQTVPEVECSAPEVECSAPEYILCEKIFVENVCGDGSGRYTGALPFRELSPVFPGMFELAVNRFLSLEKRLLKMHTVYQEYCTFMKDYLDLHHLEIVSETSQPLSCYYIPHHAVLKPDSLTTKLLVVFNASARIGNQNSPNQCLFTGKKLQQDILTILLGFRLHKYVLSTDIKHIYRQIRVDKSHCDYQRIVFRVSPDEELQEFRLLTVTYGVSSASFLALRTLLQLSEDEGREFPLAAEVLSTITYVDDIVCGGDTL